MLCLPPAAFNRRATLAVSPQPRHTRPSRAAGSCFHQFCANACRLHFCNRATGCQPYSIVAGGAGAGRSGWRTHPPAQQGRRPSVRCDQARRPDARQAVRPTTQSRRLCRRAEPEGSVRSLGFGPRSIRARFGRTCGRREPDTLCVRQPHHQIFPVRLWQRWMRCLPKPFSRNASGGARSAIFARMLRRAGAVTSCRHGGTRILGVDCKSVRPTSDGIGSVRRDPRRVLSPAPCPVVGHASYPAGPMKQPRCCLEARASG